MSIARPAASFTGGWQERNNGRSPAPGMISIARRGSAALLLLRGPARVLDRFDDGELNVVKLAIVLLDFSDTAIDRDRATRALPAQAFYGFDQRIAVGPVAGFPERVSAW